MDVISCEAVTKTFRKTQALQGLSFSIKEHTITGVIGLNGAGKTTLLKLLVGLTRPTSVRLTFSQKELMITYLFRRIRYLLMIK
ncbi:ATP-binding cassette domain-containing protein [Bacillus sp. JCM 19034]|uniref:ATP-binding cassette domain-containing protein n=1 Tax=Bacillus sp. JCM 19034 TaxID=1481928 RepID=UPI000A90E234